MSVSDNTYKDFQEISYEEFSDLLWEEVSEKIISTAYLENNSDFVNTITFEFFRSYQMDQKITVRILARLLETFFFSLFKFKPSVVNIKEIEDNY